MRQSPVPDRYSWESRAFRWPRPRWMSRRRSARFPPRTNPPKDGSESRRSPSRFLRATSRFPKKRRGRRRRPNRSSKSQWCPKWCQNRRSRPRGFPNRYQNGRALPRPRLRSSPQPRFRNRRPSSGIRSRRVLSERFPLHFSSHPLAKSSRRRSLSKSRSRRWSRPDPNPYPEPRRTSLRGRA
jgi:hypothetical protein